MISYYSSVLLLCWMALGILCTLVHENARITREDKRLLYLTYALIAVSALAEWCGLQLNGRAEMPTGLLRAVKCADYILTPLAGGALVAQMRLRNRWHNALVAILAANTAFQIAAAFNGWMLVIDEYNHYSSGPLYGVYLVVCLAIIGIILVQFVLYGRTFRRQNRVSLYAIILMVITGIAIQEGLRDGHRTAYLGLTLGAALMFIHATEFSQLAMDDFVSAQQRQINTDALTGAYSRHAYSRALKALDAAGPMPEDLAVFTIDINGLKDVNDTLGHDAGDELICGAAQCVGKTLGGAGKCYRTGGDEFVVLAKMTWEEAEAALSHLRRETHRWVGKRVKALRLAAGYALAADNPNISAEKLVREADLAMYAAKSEYYRQNGMDRRKYRPSGAPRRKETT